MAPKTSSTEPIQLHRLNQDHMEIAVVGTAPLIVHRFSEKAKATMLASQTQATRMKKEPRDPQADFEASMYRFRDGGHGFPATAFKSATINAVSLFDGLTKVSAKQAITIVGEGADQLVRLHTLTEPRMREDAARNSNGGTDLRFRAEYWPWAAVLPVRFLPNVITLESVLALVEAGGFGGVGEWRPASKSSNTGTYGTYVTNPDIDSDEDLNQVLKELDA